MANEKNEKSTAKAPSNRLGPPPKVFRFDDTNSVTGKLLEPIMRHSEKSGGPRARVILDSCTLLLPSKYAEHFSKIPPGVKVTITRIGTGRQTTYEAAWD